MAIYFLHFGFITMKFDTQTYMIAEPGLRRFDFEECIVPPQSKVQMVITYLPLRPCTCPFNTIYIVIIVSCKCHGIS